MTRKYLDRPVEEIFHEEELQNTIHEFYSNFPKLGDSKDSMGKCKEIFSDIHTSRSFMLYCKSKNLLYDIKNEQEVLRLALFLWTLDIIKGQIKETIDKILQTPWENIISDLSIWNVLREWQQSMWESLILSIKEEITINDLGEVIYMVKKEQTWNYSVYSDVTWFHQVDKLWSIIYNSPKKVDMVSRDRNIWDINKLRLEQTGLQVCDSELELGEGISDGAWEYTDPKIVDENRSQIRLVKSDTRVI